MSLIYKLPQSLFLSILLLFCSCATTTLEQTEINSSIEDIKIDTNTFIAEDITSLQEGLQALRLGKKSKLYVGKMIECNDNSCSMVLDGLSNITIFGNPSSATGIKRTGGYDEKNLLVIRSCSNIIVQDITLDEQNGARYIEDYPSSVWVDKSSNILFNRIVVRGSKGVISTGVYKTEGFSMYNSHIEDVGAFGLWLDQSSKILVQECTFKDNRSNAIFIENVYGEEWDDNLIYVNNFEHNHWDAVFNVCDGPCPGGQLDIMNASYLTIRDNNIYDGKLETYAELKLLSYGIELNDANHMIVEGNTFWNNTGNDIYMNSGHTLNEVYVKNNSFDNSLCPCTRNMDQAIMSDNTCD